MTGRPQAKSKAHHYLTDLTRFSNCSVRRRALPLLAASLSGALALGGTLGGILGCGAPAAPRPPTLNLPEPVRDLAAQRSGDTVALSWTVPARTTDRLPLKGPIQTQICRRVGNGSCDMLPQPRFRPGAAGTYQDPLPAELRTGSTRLLTYTVLLANHAGKSAGESNKAFVAAGPAPPAIQGMHALVRRDGVVLAWDPPPVGTAGPATAVRIERTALGGLRSEPATASLPSKQGPPGTSHAAASADETKREQLLLVKAADALGKPQALDQTVARGQSYRYVAERQWETPLDGHTILTLGASGQPVTVEVKDTFPPAVPRDLVAVADVEGHAIDLSWTPDPEPDLAGYVVYRRKVGGTAKTGTPETGTPERISPPGKPAPPPAFHDSTAVAGQRYAYSVAAVDVRGNESERSAEAQESLPEQQSLPKQESLPK
jgi:hypothetical protein